MSDFTTLYGERLDLSVLADARTFVDAFVDEKDAERCNRWNEYQAALRTIRNASRN